MKIEAPLEVGLVVSDLARARAFYEGALGLGFVSEVQVPPAKSREAGMGGEGYTVVRLQVTTGERIKLLAPATPPEEQAAKPGLLLDHVDTSYLTFIVDDIVATVERLIAAGATLLTASSVEVRPGTFLAFLRDPDGHVIEIVTYADVAAYRSDLHAER